VPEVENFLKQIFGIFTKRTWANFIRQPFAWFPFFLFGPLSFSTFFALFLGHTQSSNIVNIVQWKSCNFNLASNCLKDTLTHSQLENWKMGGRFRSPKALKSHKVARSAEKGWLVGRKMGENFDSCPRHACHCTWKLSCVSCMAKRKSSCVFVKKRGGSPN